MDVLSDFQVITMPRSAQSQYRIIESLEDLPLRLGQFGYDLAVLASRLSDLQETWDSE